ncbi:hypothetical protein [Flavobacterium columnare]|uniref:Uncharacterized protein n=1 Tax=Flavobacterium columnare TaxID=996 RepID=A0AAI8CGQ7_9FLAO|nr:hypothetical protein [Flavobacterium columnare]AMO19657.1 hypothetical protein UN65_04225 [Flavobacterium columnare]QOG56644.1 hypothetical protein HUE29_04285 [Flavobacterium columnare]QOG59369.1 hypothetical protein HUE30_04290 [Flavobacterium columnare]QOG62089.1 hypothetical protein HUE31_04290 [Flavobacterium columnare]QOG64812.1 hypothetical protein HUE32_04295 [Flavobacterium columnare]
MNCSYHPIAEKEINEWYCDLKFQSILDHVYYEIVKNGRRFNLGEESLKSYVEIMKMAAKNAQSKNNFDEAHAYNIALVQGLFRKYFYLKDFSFSKLIDKKSYFERYTKKWQEIVKKEKEILLNFNNKISGEKSGGIYIPSNKVVELLQDYSKKGSVQDDLNSFFGEHITIFLDSLEYARHNNLGLLEAAGIINKDFLLSSSDVSDIIIENCDTQSLQFGSQTNLSRQEKVREIMLDIPIAKIPETESKVKKKSLWKKIFG